MAETIGASSKDAKVYDPKTGKVITKTSTGTVAPQQKASTAQLTAVDNAKKTAAYDAMVTQKNKDAFPVVKPDTAVATPSTTSTAKSSSSSGTRQAATSAAPAASYAVDEVSYSDGISGGGTGGGSSLTPTEKTALSSLLDSIYASEESNYGGMRDTANASLRSAYDFNINKLAAEKEQALRDAYVSNMMSGRNINEQLSRLGITGGAAESTLARLIAEYQGARNAASGNYSSGVGELGNQYIGGVNENTNFYAKQFLDRKNSIYDTAMDYLMANYGEVTPTGTEKSYEYDAEGNIINTVETPTYSVEKDTANKLAAILKSLGA